MGKLTSDTAKFAASESVGLLSVLIPVYNEEHTIAIVIEKVLELGPIVKEIVVVDDGSVDGTAAVIEGLACLEPRIRFFPQAKNQGKTAAIRVALEQASGEILIIQDADLEYDPAEIPAVIEPILNGHADAVYGSRFLVRRAARVLYFYHYLANRFLTFLSNVLTNRNMTDIETCYKAFRAEVIKPLRLTSKGFGLEVEITAMVCKTPARTYEVPISYYGRSYEEGKKIGMKDGLAAIYFILWYNLISPWFPSTQAYLRAVRDNLRVEKQSTLPLERTPSARPRGVFEFKAGIGRWIIRAISTPVFGPFLLSRTGDVPTLISPQNSRPKVAQKNDQDHGDKCHNGHGT